MRFSGQIKAKVPFFLLLISNMSRRNNYFFFEFTCICYSKIFTCCSTYTIYNTVFKVPLWLLATSRLRTKMLRDDWLPVPNIIGECIFERVSSIGFAYVGHSQTGASLAAFLLLQQCNPPHSVSY